MRTLKHKADWDETRWISFCAQHKAKTTVGPTLKEWYEIRKNRLVEKAFTQMVLYDRISNLETFSNALVELGRREGWLEGYEYAREILSWG